jgi:hypothetical protein
LNPVLPVPFIRPHPKHHHINWFEVCLEVAVGAAIMAFLPGAVLLMAGTSMGAAAAAGTVGALEAGGAFAVSSAAATMATQGVQMAFGERSSFDMRAVVANSVAAGISGGVLQSTGMLNDGSAIMQNFNNAKLATNVMTAEGVAILQQATLHATGIEKHFDQKALALAAVNGVVGTAISTQVDNSTLSGQSISTGLNTAANQVSMNTIYHQNINPGLAIAEAVSSMAGTYAGGAMGAKLDKLAEKHKANRTIEIDVNDPELGRNAAHELSEMQSKQRMEAAPDRPHNLPAPGREGQYRSMLCDGSVSHTIQTQATQNSSVLERVMGGVTVVGGLAEVAAGIAIADTGILAIPGASLVVSGLDQFQAGYRTAVTGRQQSTSFESIVQSYGGSEHSAIGVEMAVGLMAPVKMAGEAVVSRLGMWGVRGAESTPNLAARGHISGLRLEQQLAHEEVATMFKANGELSQAAIDNAARLPLKIGNPQLKQVLSERGNLADWGKYETTPIHTSNGLARMHFYHNPVTGDLHYGADYKAVFDHQGYWNVEPSRNFSMNPGI